ncbi:TPA: single-stranded DNA-binding protein [Candidatus Kaiserbacteria bacterium]|nr:MAG: Single-stranded DNA-binding protein [Parcubacteria group bacterium GW2011_GWA1_56_13]KKW47055.1 MAG: Single-stranded DNA-binding protein [Parcubacteria group bacterium GW2011_GWB1_57_6]HCR52706.1 single-stranded DNA-binding protein [Candidatus Kaiserbacteria bacterium]
MYLNKVFLYGNLTRDPELKALPSGGQVVNFGLATNRTYKDKSGAKQEATEFHNIVSFGRTAEVIAQYMKKGRPMFVEGRIQTRSWDDKESGKKNYRTEIVVDNFQFGADGGPSRGSGATTKNEEQPAPKGDEVIKYPDEEINPEDIPF